MKKCVALLAAFALCLTFILALAACGGKVGEEIKIPFYEGGEGNIKTAAVERIDLTEIKTVGASFGYPYAQMLSSSVDGNIAAVDKERREFAKGDIIASLDSGNANYDYNAQKVETDAAYARYAASGAERDRLTWELEKKKLDKCEAALDKYNIRAPYDCVVTDFIMLKPGDFLTAGTPVCNIAKPDEVYVFTDESVGLALGMNVTVKINNIDYTGKVLTCRSALPEYADSKGASAIIGFDKDVLENIFTDTPNAISAGWATLYVKIADKYDVLCVPDAAVNKFSGEYFCYLAEDGLKTRVKVEVGGSYGGYTEIISGLTEGDVVAV